MNILLDEDFNAKIADFGESIIDRSTQNSNAQAGAGREMGTAGWAAPEMILGKGGTQASDVFSFGIILWELLTWRVPSVLITVEVLRDNSVKNHSSTFDNPLLKMVNSQRAPPPVPRPDTAIITPMNLFGGVFPLRPPREDPVQR